MTADSKSGQKAKTPKSRPDRQAQKACGTCKHFQAMNEDGGECRNRPPVAFMKLDGQLVSAFPGVRKADIWCGEWSKSA